MKFILQFLNSRIYWLVLLIGAVTAEAVALYYQYALDYGPCVLCIHIRLWLFALILLAIAALLLPRCQKVQTGGRCLALLIALGFTERSWRTLAIERYWIESSCSLESGLPTWFAPDKWWPWMFEIWESCGYTPEMVAGFTMAELLLASGVFFIIFSATAFAASVVRKTP
ncbi:disulfide bond formation protein B [Marinobacterium sediminicola]|uniref:Disulfide bond formation protein DsbB n=1 Tax=Marinobacterium sediminicola TaxID=518898 RepID=A0ABY1S2Q1_9GAMM|nr:disulfide bond formation protein B [Marinobacterium sediminicola]ULG69562.1 disulfide bond formation protein B [Marinobacterium sediminicola]SMR75715.1 disulfide bond formation protein DsbB [Marinobacterium sediminicola]